MIQSLLSPPDPSQAFPRTAWETFEARQGRKAAFEEVGDVVAVLCSSRMSLVTGVNLMVDGYVSSLSFCSFFFDGGGRWRREGGGLI